METKKCKSPSCGGKVICKGYCNTCYHKNVASKSVTDNHRTKEYTDKEETQILEEIAKLKAIKHKREQQSIRKDFDEEWDEREPRKIRN